MPAMERSEYPVIGRFVRGKSPNRTTVYRNELYRLANEVNKSYNSINNLRTMGRIVEATEKEIKNENRLRLRKELGRATRALSSINKEIRQVYADKRLSAEAKKNIIDNLEQSKIILERDAINKAKAKLKE